MTPARPPALPLALAAAAGALAVAATAAPAAADEAAADEAPAEETADRPAMDPKKQAQIGDEARLGGDEREAWQRELDARLGEEPEDLINVVNLWTDETLALPRDPDIEVGADLPRELVNDYLRCRFTGETTAIDDELVRVLVRAAKRFDVDTVEVISGFRSDKHNLNLRKKSRNVARNSQHTHGTAVDFRLPGVPVSRLHRWARSLELGGVGYYPNSHFIHVDTAEVRYWTIR